LIWTTYSGVVRKNSILLVWHIEKRWSYGFYKLPNLDVAKSVWISFSFQLFLFWHFNIINLLNPFGETNQHISIANKFVSSINSYFMLIYQKNKSLVVGYLIFLKTSTLVSFDCFRSFRISTASEPSEESFSRNEIMITVAWLDLTSHPLNALKIWIKGFQMILNKMRTSNQKN